MSKKPNRVVQYKIANEKFLEQKAQEEGIKALESGIPAWSTLDFTLSLIKIL